MYHHMMIKIGLAAAFSDAAAAATDENTRLFQAAINVPDNDNDESNNVGYVDGPGFDGSINLQAPMRRFDDDDNNIAFHVLAGIWIDKNEQNNFPHIFVGLNFLQAPHLENNIADSDNSFFDADCNDKCRLVIVVAEDCSLDAIPNKLENVVNHMTQFLPLNEDGTEMGFQYSTDNNGNIDEPEYGDVDSGNTSEKVIAALDFMDNLDWSFPSDNLEFRSMKEAIGGKVAVVYNSSGEPSFCGVMEGISQERSDIIEWYYFYAFVHKCNDLKPDDEEYVAYDCEKLVHGNIMAVPPTHLLHDDVSQTQSLRGD